MAKADGGLYEVLNLVNGKRYVGVAEFSIEARWEQHLYGLQAGYHHNKHLQAAWHKYGRDAFEFNVLERCSASDAYAMEAEIVDKEFIKDNYNRVLGGKGGDWGSSEPIEINGIIYSSVRDASRNGPIPRRTLTRYMKRVRDGETEFYNQKKHETFTIKLVNHSTTKKER